MTTPHLDRIDSIRGLAIFLVFAFHTLIIIFPGLEIKNFDENGFLEFSSLKVMLLYFNPLGQGALGVDLFLVISGFLIHLIHLRSGTELNLHIFFSKRFWRIYPPYLLTLLFFFVLNFDLSAQGIKNIVSHVLLVHNLTDNTFYTINPSFWSIALECQLYLIYPLYLLILKRTGAVNALLIVTGINIVFSSIGHFTGINSLAYGTFALKFWVIWCAGAFLADRFHNKKRIFNNPVLWLILSYLIFCVFKSWFITSRFILIPATLTCVALMEMILYYKNPEGVIYKMIMKPLAFFGLISYSVYLIHQPGLGFLISFFNPGTSYQSLNTITGVLLSSTLILLISYVLYRIVELKSIAFGQQLRSKV